MSTGLDCYIEQRTGGWYFGIEDPASYRYDPEYREEGPFATVAEMRRAFRRHANPGGYRVTCDDQDAFDREWNRS